MTRCSKCVLPDSFPAITFNSEGVCNYCTNYKEIERKGEAEFEKILSHYKGTGKKWDCIVLFSGGRDSSFALHQLVKVYKMRVLAYTFDNGLLSKEAKLNIKSAVEKLKVDHVMIKLNVSKIKRNLRRNLKAWFKKPSQKMILLFCIGCKTGVLDAYKIAKREGIHLIIDGGNTGLERTDFKTKIHGVSPGDFLFQWRLMYSYAIEMLKNPGYLYYSNLLMCLSGFFMKFNSSLLYGRSIKRVHFFEYIDWNEEKIVSTIKKELDWARPDDTEITWRTDCKLNPLKNYLYLKTGGYTEKDPFLSNLIRENMTTRKDALKRLEKENEPRLKAIEEFLEEIDLDINYLYQMEKTYSRRMG